MPRFFLKLVLTTTLAALAAFGWLLCRTGDPLYALQERLARGRFQKYDALIQAAAQRHGIDPLLLKAVVWRESEFHPHKTGSSGERGLMQVSEAAAKDWEKARHGRREFQESNEAQPGSQSPSSSSPPGSQSTSQSPLPFHMAELFDPATNLEIGAWYLQQALARWAGHDDPAAFALAQYNAGKSRVDRWVAATGHGEQATAAELRAAIDFRSTRAYVDAILKRRAFYERQKNRLETAPEAPPEPANARP